MSKFEGNFPTRQKFLTLQREAALKDAWIVLQVLSILGIFLSLLALAVWIRKKYYKTK